MDAVKTGALIAQARKEKGITQRELAERVYVSVQAVSKWELGKNFPDLALMEPLADELGLTVTELLAGERGEQPGEEAVRDSLRFGESQLRPKIKRWKWLFILAAALLLALVLWLSYVWVRDNTEWLPQRETTVRTLNPTDQEWQIARAFGESGPGLSLFEITLADDVSEISLQAELWTCHGMEQSWPLMKQSSGNMGREIFGPRRQPLVLIMNSHSEGWSEEEQRWTQVWFDCGISFAGFSWHGKLDTITNPYISGGVCTSYVGGTSRGNKILPAKVDPEEGVILMRASLGGPNGSTYAPGGEVREETVELVVRMYCK